MNEKQLKELQNELEVIRTDLYSKRADSDKVSSATVELHDAIYEINRILDHEVTNTKAARHRISGKIKSAEKLLDSYLKEFDGDYQEIEEAIREIQHLKMLAFMHK